MQSGPDRNADAVPAIDELSSRYEQVPYLSSAFAPSRPDNLNMVGTVVGLTPAPVGNCRVLEVGCAAGGNLLPMAQLLPDSRFIGIDLSQKQIEQGRQLIHRTGLGNVELRCQNILDFTGPGPFDYIIAHGFYSWVPRHVRDQVMLVCQRSLAPSGLAYFSYNTLPGWHVKRISRDMMLFHSRAAKNSAQRVARAREMMAMALANPPPEQTPHGSAVRQLAAGIASCPDWFLEHDELGLVNDPVYFEDFVRHAQSYQLRYVCGAQPQMNLFQQLPASLRDQLRTFSSDPVMLEQYADYIWGSQYRDSVLCRTDAPLSRNQGPAAIQGMFVAASLLEQPIVPERQQPNEARFWDPLKKREVTASDARSIAVLRSLARSWPHAVSFGELLAVFSPGNQAQGEARPGDLLSNQVISWYLTGVVELWTRPTEFISAEPSRPCVTPLARAQAEAGAPLVNLRHEECRFADSLLNQLVLRMDGTRDRAGLLYGLTEILKRNELIPRAPGQGLTSNEREDAFLGNVLKTLSNHSLFTSRSAIA